MVFSPLTDAPGVLGPGVLPPVRETPIAMAVKVAMESPEQESTRSIPTEEGRLRLSHHLLIQPASGDLPPVNEPVDDGIGLRLSDAQSGRFRASPPASSRPPRQLGQMILTPAAGAKEPLWMSLPDEPARLRSSRQLSLPMPGAAGTGRSARQVPGSGDPDEGPVLPVSPGLPPARPTQAAGASESGAGSSPTTVSSGSTGVFGWEIPPVRWGGSVGYNFQKSSSNSGYASSSQGMFANLNTASYIYAPWFARVSGRIGFTTSSSSSSSSGVGENDTGKASNVVGGAEVNMFSSSRYPFRAFFDRSDSRASGNFVASNYINDRFGLTQNFRSEDGMSGGSFLLDRSVVTTSDRARDEVTALSGSYSMQTGVVQHNVNGRYSLGKRNGTNEQARLIGFNTAHNANISDTLNLGATVNYSDSDIRTMDGLDGTYTSRGRFLQLYSFGSWLPEFEDLDDLPLTLNGGLRYASQDTQFGNEGFSNQSFGGNLAASYRFSRNLNASANGAMNYMTLPNRDGQLLTQLGSSINYVGDPLTFGNFSYNWNTGGNLTWQGAIADTPANAMLGGQASHSLARNYTVGEGRTVTLNVSQSLSAINSQFVGSSQSLNHTFSANYGLSAGERFSGSMNAMISDVRTSGYNEQSYQTLNLGFYGQGQLSQQSTANINLMFNWSDQTYQSVDAFGLPVTQNAESMAVNGSASYSHIRFAGVRGLRYNLIFAADSRLRDDRLFGNVNGEVDRARFSLTNRLEYTIGLLDFRLSLVNNETGGKKNALVFFQVSRQIGSY